MCLKEQKEKEKKTLPNAWTVVNGQVVDLQRLSQDHPGGAGVLEQTNGQDSTVLFHTVHTFSNGSRVQKSLQSNTIGDVKDFVELNGMEGCIEFNWEQEMSDFAVDLRKSVRAYFTSIAQKNGTSIRSATKAPTWKWILIAIIFCTYVCCVILYLSGSTVAMIVLPLPSALLAFHTFHDGSHGALSTKPWVNDFFTYTSPFLSAPHEWRWQHIVGHHAFTNIADYDPDSKHARRWIPPTPPEERFRATVAVVMSLWALAVPVGLHMIASVKYFSSGACRPSMSSMMALVMHRFVFWVIPLFRFGLLWGFIWITIPAVGFSLVFMLATQLAHLTEVTGGEQEQEYSKCWYEHQIHSTVDIAPQCRFSWFWSGGLNNQVTHHCFPTVDHSHLPALRSVLEKVCSRHDVKMNYFPGFLAGFKAHLALLAVGSEESNPTGSEESNPRDMSSSAMYVGRIWHKRPACHHIVVIFLALMTLLAGQGPCAMTFASTAASGTIHFAARSSSQNAGLDCTEWFQNNVSHFIQNFSRPAGKHLSNWAFMPLADEAHSFGPND